MDEMPDVLIELRGNWLDGRKVDSIEAIEDGIATSLKALKDLGLIEHASIISASQGGRGRFHAHRDYDV
jgi:hypothetical protein